MHHSINVSDLTATMLQPAFLVVLLDVAVVAGDNVRFAISDTRLKSFNSTYCTYSLMNIDRGCCVRVPLLLLTRFSVIVVSNRCCNPLPVTNIKSGITVRIVGLSLLRSLYVSLCDVRGNYGNIRFINMNRHAARATGNDIHDRS